MNWRTPVTMLVLLGVLLGAAYYGWQTIISPEEDSKAAGPTATGPSCKKQVEFKKGQLIRARDIVVNVYNAGSLSGLAGQTLSALDDKGFKAGVAENAPTNLAVTNVTVLGDRSSPEVRLVAQQFRGPVKVTKGPQLAAGIDVVVGENFRAVDDQAHTALRLQKAVSSCVAIKKKHRN
jgi:hypothetical protein